MSKEEPSKPVSSKKSQESRFQLDTVVSSCQPPEVIIQLGPERETRTGREASMMRQPVALFGGLWKRMLLGASVQKRKVFLLVFLWTCLCILLLKTSLFSANKAHRVRPLSLEQADSLQQQFQQSQQPQQQDNVIRKQVRAAVSAAPDEAELASPSNREQYLSSGASYVNGNALHTSSSPAQSLPLASAAVPSRAGPSSSEGQQVSSGGGGTSTSSQATHKSPSEAARVVQPSNKGAQLATVPDASQLQNSCNYDYPSLFDLQFNNIHWQKMTTKPLAEPQQSQQPNEESNDASKSAATFYLYNAYYDDRWRGGVPSVRLLAMIDRVKLPPTNCLLWSNKLTKPNSDKLKPIVTRASFVYAWYPKWGNYKDGILQPWIVTCPLVRPHLGLVPDSVSLVEAPVELEVHQTASFGATTASEASGVESSVNTSQAPRSPDSRQRRQATDDQEQPSVGVVPPSLSSSSSSSSSSSPSSTLSQPSPAATNNNNNNQEQSTKPMRQTEYDCKRTLPITNNLPVYNRRPQVKQKFAVCVKGLDFPHDDVSIRLVEWIEMLNLLGASKIFLYELDVHKNISKVLNYYQQRGMVELSPLTLPGDQPNLPEYQHLYLKNKLTAKRQNELIPYNDCLYRNLYSYEYLALLDIDEVIMPLGKHQNWYDLMQQVESVSLAEQNYSRASYNVRNVYFFDDLSGPMGTTSTSSSSSLQVGDGGIENDSNNQRRASKEEEANELVNTGDKVSEHSGQSQEEGSGVQRGTEGSPHDSLERGVPHYLHMMSHVYRSKNYTEPGQYVKCFHNTERVVSLHNHFPMNCFGQCTTYSIPVQFAHLQHYRKDCVGPLRQSCKKDFRVFTTRDTTIWKYRQRMIKRTTRVLNHLGLLAPDSKM